MNIKFGDLQTELDALISAIKDEPELLTDTINAVVRIHKEVEEFGIHEYQKIWYRKS